MKSIFIAIILALMVIDSVSSLQLNSEMNLSTDIDEDEMVFLELEEQSLKDEASEEDADKKKDSSNETSDSNVTMKVGDPCPCGAGQDNASKGINGSKLSNNTEDYANET